MLSFRSLAMMAVAGLALGASAATSVQAGVLASTNFNDSAIGGATNVKTNLNWTLNGLADPGDMAALNAGGSPQTLFDANTFVQDIFIPGLNTGNGDTYWTTDISITVVAGFNVTLTDVTLNAVSVSPDYSPLN